MQVLQFGKVGFVCSLVFMSRLGQKALNELRISINDGRRCGHNQPQALLCRETLV